MVWPPSVRGILVTESVRGDGGILKNKDGKRFIFDYIPEFFKADTADTEAEADRWYEDKKNNRRPPELLPRDEVARAINAEVKAGRGSPAGGAYLDIASRRTPEYINKRLPSMYHQFKELADVDITKEPMEVGPTCHYIMGGIEVDADSQAAVVPGLYAAGEVGGGMHGSNRLGGNSLGDLLVFGQRAGRYAAEYARSATAKIADGQIEVAAKEATAPFDREDGENPYALHAELQATMNELVGIIRDAEEMAEALNRLQTFKERAKHLSVTGNRQFNPGWHLAIDLQNMLLCSEMVAVAAIERKESRGGHTRNDYPVAVPEWGTKNIILSEKDGTVSFTHKPLPVMPDELKALFEETK
jgi:succinate dehydrogenase / fumarate reductase flavoprotein subunit